MTDKKEKKEEEKEEKKTPEAKESPDVKEDPKAEAPKKAKKEDPKAEPKEQPKEEKKVPTSVQIPNRMSRRQGETIEWIPKTRLGKEVVAGKYGSVEEILNAGEIILEPEIIDYLIPDLKQEIIYIGGTPGKGGGARRTPTRMTARMHKSGRRFKLTALIAVGNENGILGLGKATSQEHMVAISKAAQQAKLNVINVKRGCGSWECNCGGNHSIHLKTQAKVSSVTVKFFPTPTGVGIVADNETKKILRLAGVKDVWVKTYGKTSTRMNLAFAVYNALKRLSVTKGDF
ncbi:MAG: 30S ribosomal protein S5 [Candidatus Aenigmarchaeota archaeon]|nr:30S ribosomal protein S5 [Candidatus Aenigmarchaeota archaeon]